LHGADPGAGADADGSDRGDPDQPTQVFAPSE
jgi:hypothetical protein